MTEPVFPFSVPNSDYERFCKMSALLARLPPSNVIFHSSDLVCFTSLTYAVRMANVIFHSSDFCQPMGLAWAVRSRTGYRTATTTTTSTTTATTTTTTTYNTRGLRWPLAARLAASAGGGPSLHIFTLSLTQGQRTNQCRRLHQTHGRRLARRHRWRSRYIWGRGRQLRRGSSQSSVS